MIFQVIISLFGCEIKLSYLSFLGDLKSRLLLRLTHKESIKSVSINGGTCYNTWFHSLIKESYFSMIVKEY
jgi:hypothetical protein